MNSRTKDLLLSFSLLLSSSVMAEVAPEDPFAALDRLLEDNFNTIDLTLDEQFEILNQAMEDGYQKLGKEVALSWGTQEVKLPTTTTWVDYSDDLNLRRMIDFELGTISIERIIDIDDKVTDIVADIGQASRELQTDSLADLAKKDTALKYARETLEARGLELVEPTQSGAKQTPVLAGSGQMVTSMSLEEAVNQALEMETTDSGIPGLEGKADKIQATMMADIVAPPFKASVTPLVKNRRKVSIQIPLKANFRHLLADEYLATVATEASRQDLPPSLLLAVMETESHFNPRARSAVPAYGLMQLVPRSGAMDAYEKVYGEKTLLGPEYLYQPDNNMELGAAYLHILHNRYLRHITDPDSLQYCAIAAYNTGAGNVARSFTGKTNVRTAARLINTMTPNEVYTHLQENLPYEETRRYLVKVTEAQKKYFAFDEIATIKIDESFRPGSATEQIALGWVTTVPPHQKNPNQAQPNLLRYVSQDHQQGTQP